MTPAQWIRSMRDHMKLKQVPFAEEVGVTQPTVSRWESGTEPERDHWRLLTELAERVGYPAFDTTRPREIPIIGYVGAGAAIYPFDEGEPGVGFDVIHLPHGMRGAFGLLVRGDSMYPKYEDGEVVICDDVVYDPQSLVGRYCYVKLADGRAFLKKLRNGSERGLYSLHSHNAAPIEDVALVDAFPVAWTKPARAPR